MYEEYEAPFGGSFIKKENSDGTTAWIPRDESNVEYQRYLQWLNGEPEPIVYTPAPVEELLIQEVTVNE